MSTPAYRMWTLSILFLWTTVMETQVVLHLSFISVQVFWEEKPHLNLSRTMPPPSPHPTDSLYFTKQTVALAGWLCLPRFIWYTVYYFYMQSHIMSSADLHPLAYDFFGHSFTSPPPPSPRLFANQLDSVWSIISCLDSDLFHCT